MNLPDGVTDPHIRIFRDRAYLYASHDHDAGNQRFDMRDWQVWSSSDLVDWKQESTLRPEDTYIGKPIQGCWATDAIEKDGQYFWFFSEVVPEEDRRQVGAVVGDSPAGPWQDYLGQPFLPDGLVPTEVYDPCLFKDLDGSLYIVFGVWDFYIARVRKDMTGITGQPRKLEIINPEGPYGKGRTDDKVFLHHREGIYYLSWGCYYATSRNLLGPFLCRGSFITPNRIDATFREPTWPHGPTQGRHGAFFDWKGQSYFAYCDMSRTGNRYFRASWISYVHYRANGEIDPIRIEPWAVGQYEANQRDIPAIDFFCARHFVKQQDEAGDFYVGPLSQNASLVFPNTNTGANPSCQLELSLRGDPENATVRIHRGNPAGMLLGSATLNGMHSIEQPPLRIPLSQVRPREDLCLVFGGTGLERLALQSFRCV